MWKYINAVNFQIKNRLAVKHDTLYLQNLHFLGEVSFYTQIEETE